jgi:SAM-dependent methyltransferase
MFFADVATALANLARSLRPGGRLVLLTWQPPSDNEWISAWTSAVAAGRDLPAPPTDRPGPFALSDPDRLARMVQSAGFEAPTVRGLRHPMYIGRDVAEALEKLLEQFRGSLDELDAEGRRHAMAALRSNLEEHQTPEGVAYASATWLTTAVRAA